MFLCSVALELSNYHRRQSVIICIVTLQMTLVSLRR